MVSFDILTKENLKMVKVTMDNEEVRIESGAMYYTKGKVLLKSAAPSASGILKSFMSGEKVIRPVYSGTGELYLEPSYGEFTVLEINDEEWILDKGAYYASEMSVNIDIFRNKALTGLVSGEGLFQTKVAGTGKVIITSHGPLETIELTNDKLVVDGSFAVARTGKLEYKVEKAAKGIFSSIASGEGLVNTFEGTGKVLLAPVPLYYAAVMSHLGDLKTLVRGYSSS